MDLIMNFHYRNKMVVNFFRIIFLMAFSYQSSAVYQDTRPYELMASDEKLNECYKKIFNKLSVTDQSKLKKAQRQWMRYRDLDCKNEPIDCIIERTDTRTKELQETRFFDKKGNYLSMNCEQL